jgi:Bacterial conjugation TrbI-like protein
MNRTEENKSHGTQIVEEPAKQSPEAGVVANSAAPFVPEKDQARSLLKDNSRLLFVGAGIVMVLLLLAFSGISRRISPVSKTSSAHAKQGDAQVPNNARPPSSVIPILDTGRSAEQESDSSLVNPDQVGRTATKQPKSSPGANLGSIRPFDNSESWQPAPFQARSEPETLAQTPLPEPTEHKAQHDAMDKVSLVFVRNNSTSAATARVPESLPHVDLGIGLPPGTRLRARLETALNTAVQTPVVAVIEYNYEQNGEIVIPAGAKAFGHLEAADQSGYVGVRFDSLMMSDGSSLSLEAVATDLQLRPLRGKVEGKHAGKNILVRSFAGIGEIAATLVGRGSVNQPLSESDLLRERMTNNIGQSSDQTIANLALTERIVVSVPADTEIYVILQKPAKQVIQSQGAQLSPQHKSQPSIEELRQLMQLQRELNRTDGGQPTPE